MIRLALSAAVAALLLSLPAGADLLSPDQKAQMMSADVVLLGEFHDNPAHHAGQAALLAQIAPRAVVFEMLTPQMATKVQDRDPQTLDTLGDLIGWEAAGWPDFAIYQPIFEALGDAMVIGAAAPRDTVRAAFDQGAAAVFGTGAAQYGLTDPLSQDEQATREALQFAAHCDAMPMDLMGGMVEAQRLRDAQFADAALTALRDQGTPVVIIAGNGHLRNDWGVPFMLRRAAPDLTVFSIGFGEGADPFDDPRYDAHVVTDTIPREDPCAAFKNNRRPPMYIAMNRFKVTPENAEAFEALWLGRDSHLKQMDGFVEFHMLRGGETDGLVLYASHTVWASEEAFRAWARSDAFRAAHKGAGTTAKLHEGAPTFEGFTTIQHIQ